MKNVTQLRKSVRLSVKFFTKHLEVILQGKKTLIIQL